MAQIIGILPRRETTTTLTVLRPYLRSGSLLLKVGDEAKGESDPLGQEKDSLPVPAPRMNMILHNTPLPLIMRATLGPSQLQDGDRTTLKTFDYVRRPIPLAPTAFGAPASDPLNILTNGFFNPFASRPSKRALRFTCCTTSSRSLSQKDWQRPLSFLPHGVPLPGKAEADIRRTLSEGLHQGNHRPARQPVYTVPASPPAIVVIDKHMLIRARASL